MTPAARLSAAIEVLDDIATRRRPAPDALKDWGLARRFAGSKDRAAIASLVYDSLRRRASAAFLMGEDSPRGVLIGTLRLARGMTPPEIAALCSGERFAPAPLSSKEEARLDGSLDHAPAPVAGDFPDWIEPSLRRVFEGDTLAEMAALAARAPLDLRINTLKTSREDAQPELAHLHPEPTRTAPYGLRIAPGADGRGPPVQAEPAFQRGWFEIQDEGSQLAALLAQPIGGERVVDLCAGGGGKTLALAAAMGNAGLVVATDRDIRRLAPIHDRLSRAGVTCVEVRTPRGDADVLADLDGTADCVFVDAPCTGTGTWRRHPDAKWRLRPGGLRQRVNEQVKVLDRAARLVRPGGRIAYVTCSVLPEENDDAIAGVLGRSTGLSASPVPDGIVPRNVVRATRFGVQMTPLRTDTDGFYVAIMRRGA